MSDRPMWRRGNHYSIHVYHDNRPVATFHRPADAAAAVDAFNTVQTKKRDLYEQVQQYVEMSTLALNLLIQEGSLQNEDLVNVIRVREHALKLARRLAQE